MASRSRQDKSAAIPSTLIESLTRWFRKNARDLPWRRNPTPYRVWVSEVMLQQTRAEAVRGYFQRFTKRFPTMKALAAAHEDEVLAAWSGLGYYRRARMLHAAAREIVAQHGGRFPRGAAAIEALPGVGRYTAGAIRSIALGELAPIVDGNIERVFARLRAFETPMKTPAAGRAAWAWARKWVEQAGKLGIPPAQANQALMELGATICTPRNPKCLACPAREWCKARAVGKVAELPHATEKRPARKVRLLFPIIINGAGELLLVRRKESGGSLLPVGVWELPHIEWPAGAHPADLLRGALGPRVDLLSDTFERRHAIMDARIQLVGLPLRVPGLATWPGVESRWLRPNAVRALARSSATTKLLEAWKERDKAAGGTL